MEQVFWKPVLVYVETPLVPHIYKIWFRMPLLDLVSNLMSNFLLTALTDPTETAPSRKQNKTNKQKQKPRAVHIRCVVYIWATVDHVNNHSCRIQFSKSDDIKSTENFQTQSQISASSCDLFYMLDRHIFWGLVPLKTTVFNKVHKELQLPLSLTQNTELLSTKHGVREKSITSSWIQSIVRNLSWDTRIQHILDGTQWKWFIFPDNESHNSCFCYLHLLIFFFPHMTKLPKMMLLRREGWLEVGGWGGITCFLMENSWRYRIQTQGVHI